MKNAKTKGQTLFERARHDRTRLRQMQTHNGYLVDLIDRLENENHNLKLYLDYVRQVDPTLYNTMQAEFVALRDYPEARYERGD